MFPGRQEKRRFLLELAALLQINRRRPPLASNDSTMTYNQNVAGLWLKYGIKSLKIDTYGASKDSLG